jgi:ribosomal RNA-processing protein 7
MFLFVVVTKTGRKKTTDETGLSMGAIALEATDNRGNKKRKEKADAALDFYRFQRHEARRNGEDCVIVFFIFSVPLGL